MGIARWNQEIDDGALRSACLLFDSSKAPSLAHRFSFFLHICSAIETDSRRIHTWAFYSEFVVPRDDSHTLRRHSYEVLYVTADSGPSDRSCSNGIMSQLLILTGGHIGRSKCTLGYANRYIPRKEHSI